MTALLKEVIGLFTTSIIGCGSIAQVHAAVIHDRPEISLLSAADIVGEKAEALTQKYGGRAFRSIDELLADRVPDVVHICTPHCTHVRLAVQALQSGANVLMEKPPFISEDDRRMLREAASHSGKALGICFQNRYKPNVRLAKSLIDSEEYGKIIGARAFVTWQRDEAYYTKSGWRGKWATEGGGVLINQAIHTLDLMLWLVGDPLTVEGSIHNHHLKDVIEVEDTAEMFLDFGGGIHGLFYATTANCSDSPVYLEITCENGRIVLEGENLRAEDREGRIRQFFSNPPMEIGGKACWGNGHILLIADYYACLAARREFPIGLAEGSRAMHTLLRFYQAASSGKTVPCR